VFKEQLAHICYTRLPAAMGSNRGRSESDPKSSTLTTLGYRTTRPSFPPFSFCEIHLGVSEKKRKQYMSRIYFDHSHSKTSLNY